MLPRENIVSANKIPRDIYFSIVSSSYIADNDRERRCLKSILFFVGSDRVTWKSEVRSLEVICDKQNIEKCTGVWANTLGFVLGGKGFVVGGRRERGCVGLHYVHFSSWWGSEGLYIVLRERLLTVDHVAPCSFFAPRGGMLVFVCFHC